MRLILSLCLTMTATALIRVIKPMQQMNAMDGLGVGAMKDRTPAASIMRRNTVRTGINTAHTSEHFEIVFVSANMIANMTSSSTRILQSTRSITDAEATTPFPLFLFVAAFTDYEPYRRSLHPESLTDPVFKITLI